MERQRDIDKLNWVSRILIVIATVFVCIALFSFFLNRGNASDFVATGPITDNVSEIIGQFVNIAFSNS